MQTEKMREFPVARKKKKKVKLRRRSGCLELARV
jgi:hypothetical protein